MLTQVDFYLEYIRGGKCFTDATFPDPPYNEREAHALRLRALFEQWIPPDLTDEMILTVRRLLYAEGCEPPGGWDNIHPPSEPMADSLIWS